MLVTLFAVTMAVGRWTSYVDDSLPEPTDIVGMKINQWFDGICILSCKTMPGQAKKLGTRRGEEGDMRTAYESRSDLLFERTL